MQSTKRGDGRNDTYLRLPEMAPAEEENASLLASGKRRSLGSVDAIALKLLASRRRASVDGTSNDIPDERVARGALIAARRWKSTTKRVTNMRRMRDAIDEVLERHNPGAAPGIDPRRSKYHHLASKWCLPARITVVDYCAKDITIHSGLDGAGDLSAFLSQPREDNGHVRWIHVDGLNWDVVQVLALKFDLHPLALEDTVHVPQRIKADFYDSCLYVALIYLYLAGGNGSSGTDDTITDPATSGNGVADGGVQQPASDSTSSRSLPRTISIVTKTDSAAAAAAVSSRPASRHGSANLGGGSAAAATVTPRQLDLEDDGGFFECRQSRTLNAGPTHWPLPLRHGSVCMAPRQPVGGCGGATGGGDHGASSAQEPSGGGAVSIHVSAQQVSLFLLRGEHPNVLITIFQSDGSKVTDPILEQLKEPRTLVREAEDASFLANLVIDTLVDHIFPVVSAYREQLQQYEMDVTGSGPSAAASTRELHAMQRDLRRIDRTIAPLQWWPIWWSGTPHRSLAPPASPLQMAPPTASPHHLQYPLRLPSLSCPASPAPTSTTFVTTWPPSARTSSVYLRSAGTSSASSLTSQHCSSRNLRKLWPWFPPSSCPSPSWRGYTA
ncbi:hypothetical protein Vretifemale_8878 [Volvox reticuliferus]|uniref:Uncharacterized protein n=1 Tax=Volvox reticuliferus TaxID=1737510 RepID=A0A8J4CEV4_9CHLO|nr:hypothetical protein Vretifemale_8878 [Volvox reticuliferus]